MNHAYISLGSNLGDRHKLLKLAIHRMSTIGVVEKLSSFIETEPQEVVGQQPSYINALAQLATTQSAAQLLMLLRELELKLGRERAEKGQKKSRPIDLDIIAFNDEVHTSDTLVIPHPRMQFRDFVLIPLVEISPDWRHPVLQQTATELLKELPQSQGR